MLQSRVSHFRPDQPVFETAKRFTGAIVDQAHSPDQDVDLVAHMWSSMFKGYVQGVNIFILS